MLVFKMPHARNNHHQPLLLTIVDRILISYRTAGSAFLLLSYNPNWLWDLGFQLSYAAVLSIVLLMKPIENLVFVKNRLLQIVWAMTATSIAAQVLTTPLTLLLFQKFPLYFLITNLVAIPLSSLIVIGEVILCLTGFFEPIAGLIGSCVHFMIRLMNEFVMYMNQLPLHSLQWQGEIVATTSIQYAVMFALFAWYKNKRPLFLITALSFANVYALIHFCK